MNWHRTTIEEIPFVKWHDCNTFHGVSDAVMAQCYLLCLHYVIKIDMQGTHSNRDEC